MKSIKKALCVSLAVLVVLGLLIASFKAYVIRSVDLKTQIVYDGLGRVLSEPPLLLKLVTDQKAWAGFGWHLIDCVWGFGGIAIAFWLFSIADEK